MLSSQNFKDNVKNICRNIKGYLLSDTKYQGEGEMKILNCIRNLDKKNNICVYSPDSDMIILLMLLKQNTLLLRYDQQKSKDSDKEMILNFIEINNFKKLFQNNMIVN
ncbi:MAG: hypothetical protein HN597_12860, partial [Desulfobacula sp.]|uniref:hypothetical protein n=1 Tax=Desulfobacula sp. TaxID=2593537 RepID=UPI0039B89537|nr:hypothetical protein [Desulfobacula sp.]